MWRDRRLWLLGAVLLLTLVVGLYSLSPQTSVEVVSHAGYWVLLALFAFYVRALFRLGRAHWSELRAQRLNRKAIALVVLTGAVLLAHEKYGFKILADEVLLLGTSMSLHHDRRVGYPMRAQDVQGPFLLMQRVVDKRPFFYPFLVALAHDFTGYRPENAFYVNTVLGFIFLGLVYLLARRISGSEWGGAFAVLLFAGLPLLAQQMKGGGFELLNLVMLASTALLAMRFAMRRDELSLEALCFSALLLAFTRYESILVLVPIALLVLWGWRKEGKVVLTWPVILAPLSLVMYLLQHRIFSARTSAWELASRPEATTPFGLHYLPDNVGHALAFFFNTSGYQPNSPFFAAIGLCALPFFLLWIAQSFTVKNAQASWRIGVAAAGFGLLGITGLLMVYFWGQIDHPVIHRLSLPVHLLMIVAIAAAGGQLIRDRRGWQGLCAAALAALVFYSLPIMSRRAYAHSYSPAVEMEWRQDFLERYPDHDYLFIDNDSVFWIAHEIPATSAQEAQARKDGLIFHLRNRSFSEMYVFQRVKIDPETGEGVIEKTDDLGPDFELETVWERRIQTLYLGRISRVTAIREGGTSTTAEPLANRPVAPERTEAEIEQTKEEFVKQWVRNLP